MIQGVELKHIFFTNIVYLPTNFMQLLLKYWKSQMWLTYHLASCQKSHKWRRLSARSFLCDTSMIMQKVKCKLHFSEENRKMYKHLLTTLSSTWDCKFCTVSSRLSAGLWEASKQAVDHGIWSSERDCCKVSRNVMIMGKFYKPEMIEKY